jgi:hypothetical protein
MRPGSEPGLRESGTRTLEGSDVSVDRRVQELAPHLPAGCVGEEQRVTGCCWVRDEVRREMARCLPDNVGAAGERRGGGGGAMASGWWRTW